MCETRGIRADLHFPLGSGSASPSRPVASGCEVDAGICVVRCRTGPNLPHSLLQIRTDGLNHILTSQAVPWAGGAQP